MIAFALTATGCRETPARFTVQAEGERFFVRAVTGGFSVLLPCKPEPAARGGSGQPLQIACDREGQRISLTVLPHAASPALDSPPLSKIYEAAMQELEAWRGASRSDSSVRKVAGRNAQYVVFSQIDGAAASAHVWLVWVEEQRALYQLMVVGDGGPALGEALARTLLVPSP